MNDGTKSTDTGTPPLAKAAVTGASGFGLADVDLHLRPQRVQCARDPGRQPAATPRDEHGVDVVELLDELEPDRAVARHDRRILHRVHEETRDVVAEVALLVGLDGRPPLLPRDADDPASQPLDGCKLRRGRVVGDDDRRRHTELTRHPGDALRHVSGARRHETLR